MRVWLYHRVSTLDQRPENATQELEQAARAYPGIVVAVTETGSGANNDRPGLKRVLRESSNGDVVLVWKLDRWGRTASDVLANIAALKAKGVGWRAVTQGLESKPGASDPTSNLLLAILASVAEFERSLIQERTRMGLAAARRRGSRLGRPRVELGPAALALVVQLRLGGMPWRKVAVALRAEGYEQAAHMQGQKWKPARAWSPSTLQGLVEKRGAKKGIAELRSQCTYGNGPASVD